MLNHQGKNTMILRVISSSSDLPLTEVRSSTSVLNTSSLLKHKPVLETKPWDKDLHSYVPYEEVPPSVCQLCSTLPGLCIGGENELLLAMRKRNSTEAPYQQNRRLQNCHQGWAAETNTHFSARVCCSLMPTLKSTGWTLSNMPLWISRGSKSNKALGKGILTLNPSLWTKKEIWDEDSEASFWESVISVKRTNVHNAIPLLEKSVSVKTEDLKKLLQLAPSYKKFFHFKYKPATTTLILCSHGHFNPICQFSDKSWYCSSH